MRDAYILDIATQTLRGDTSAARLEEAAALLAARVTAANVGVERLDHLAVSSTEAPMARWLGLLAGISAGLSAMDVGAGSGTGLDAVGDAVRAVTSGFEDVAAAVAWGGPHRSPSPWPEALKARWSPVSVPQQRTYARQRAGLSVEDLVEAVELRRAAWVERGEVATELEWEDGLPLALERASVGVCVLAGHREIRERGWGTRARVTSVVRAGVDPGLGPAGVALAATRALHRLQLRADELGMVQVDAQDAVAPALVAQALGFGADKVNVLGDSLCNGRAGAAAGLDDLQRLLTALETLDRRFGMVVGIEADGTASAVVVDRAFYL